ncbi:hypothetical protein HU200_034358 [Digitaria exilis]|uniref:Thioredoxin domain-containing protein n=1 Tax=Digitaria exilis TaxID=1010633 RepID=A0A835BK69_9POAL|nr:hypothetical protein HU200_034358 [Digitaria exilis]
MISSKLKSVDFYRKIPRDLTEASLSGAGLSIVAALTMMLLFGMELSNYLAVNTTTSVIVDRSSDGEFLRIDFNISFPALSCEFASVDVSDVLGTNRLNITKTVRKFSIDRNLVPTGSEFHPGPIPIVSKHGDDVEEDNVDGSVPLSSRNFDSYSHQYPVLVVNFYAPWCYWSNRLKPSWEKTAKIIRERHHIQGYPSIRVFRKGSDIKENQGHHDHESYYGERDTESLVTAMETYVANIPKEAHVLALEDKSNKTVDPAKRPAPMAGGCRIEASPGFQVPGSVVISARSGSHSFDPSQINVSHYVTQFSFGKRLSQRMFSEFVRLTPYLRGYHDRLSGQSYVVKHGEVNANVTIEHYLQVVKTELVTLRSSKELKVLEEYEYTAHSSLVHSFYVPVVKFHFEPSPMQVGVHIVLICFLLYQRVNDPSKTILINPQVLVTEVPRSFSHFITNVCAIIGGVFTVRTRLLIY